MKRALNISLILAGLLLTACAAEAFLPPVLVARKLPAGLSGTAVSQRVAGLPPSAPRFEHYLFGYVPTQQTEVRLAYDDANLYVHYSCAHGRMDSLAAAETTRDGAVLADDSVWLGLDLDSDRKTYLMLAANAAGTLLDNRGRGNLAYPWDGDWSAEATKGATGWRLLMKLPFRTLGMKTPSAGQSWGVNFGRFCKAYGERSCWTQIIWHIRQPDRWGRLLFAGEQAVVASVSPDVPHREREFAPCGTRAAGDCQPPATPIGVPGSHPVDLRISNPSAKAAALQLKVIIDDRVTETRSHRAPPGSSVWSTRFEVLIEGEHQLRFALCDAHTGQTLMRTPVTWVYIPKHRERIAAMREMMKSVEPASGEGRSRRQRLQSKLDSLESFAQAVRSNDAGWQELGKRVKAVEHELHYLRSLAADRTGRGYAVGVENPMHKVYRDELFAGRFLEPLSISAAKCESESAQAVVLAYGRSLSEVRLTVSPLVGPNGAVIDPAGSLKLNLVDYVNTGNPRYAAEHIGWTPDPLMDPEPFDLAKGALQPIWVTVRPGQHAAAGLYRGCITITPADAEPLSLPVEVRVWDFELPARPALQTAFAFFEHEMRGWYGDYTTEMRDRWYEFLLDHRINPTNIYSSAPRPEREMMEFCADRGLNAFTLTCTWYKDGEDLKELLATLAEDEQFLKPRGWWDEAYVYGFDELDLDRYPELRSTYGEIKKRFPDLRTMTTCVPNEDLDPELDIFVPLTAMWNPQDARKYTERGNEVWWYVCCHPFHPYPNFFMEYPSIDSRILFWMNWKYSIPGVLYYAINIWEHNRVTDGEHVHTHEDPAALKAIAEGKRWPEVPWNTFSCATWNGDGQLIYPGPNGQPISSIRFECIRDGIEDYEYFHQLRLLTREAEAAGIDPVLVKRAKSMLEISDEIVASPSDYTLDTHLLLSTRARTAQMIERLGSVLKGKQPAVVSGG